MNKTICWMIRDETGETYIDENCLWLHEADAVEAAGLMGDPGHTYTAFAVAAVEPAQPVEAAYALHLCITELLHDGVSTDPEHPRRVALNAAEAALAHPRPTGEEPCSECNGAGWTSSEPDDADRCVCNSPAVEQAGEVVAFRWLFDGDYKSAWMDGKPDQDLIDMANRNGRGTEFAYAQPRPVGVPDGWKLAPFNPNYTMLDEARNRYGVGTNLATDVYKAMLAAAPAPAKAGGA